MAQQTAVEWFFENLNSHKIQLTANELFEQAKQIEKEQIVNSWDLSRRDIDYPADGEKYYNETYGNETK
jgi:hypothetical protein